MSKLNVEVWEKPVEEEQPIAIRVMKSAGQLEMSMVNENGVMLNRGYLLAITEAGELRRAINIHPKLAARAGIQLDSEGRIKLEE